jgi:hypothetical protein
MDQELQKAIDVIENAGGFVMLSDDEISYIESRYEVDSDYAKRKKEAFKEATHALHHNRSLSFTDIEDIMSENGMDMDEIEDWIESQI